MQRVELLREQISLQSISYRKLAYSTTHMNISQGVGRCLARHRSVSLKGPAGEAMQRVELLREQKSLPSISCRKLAYSTTHMKMSQGVGRCLARHRSVSLKGPAGEAMQRVELLRERISLQSISYRKLAYSTTHMNMSQGVGCCLARHRSVSLKG